MRLIFLDIDGVLNSARFYQTRDVNAPEWADCFGKDRRWLLDLDPEAITRLNRLTNATDARLVISSTWRQVCTPSTRLNRILATAGVTGTIIGHTPRLARYDNAVDVQRGMEIDAWLLDAREHGSQVESFVILDDDRDIAHLMDRLVQTTWNEGLQDEHVERALALLRGG